MTAKSPRSPRAGRTMCRLVACVSSWKVRQHRSGTPSMPSPSEVPAGGPQPQMKAPAFPGEQAGTPAPHPKTEQSVGRSSLAPGQRCCQCKRQQNSFERRKDARLPGRASGRARQRRPPTASWQAVGIRSLRPIGAAINESCIRGLTSNEKDEPHVRPLRFRRRAC